MKDTIAGVKIGKILSVAKQDIAGGRGCYILADYSGEKDGQQVRITVYDSKDGYGINRHPRGLESEKSLVPRMIDKIKLYKFGHPANLSDCVDSPWIPQVLDVGEAYIQVSREAFRHIFAPKPTGYEIRKQNLVYMVTEPTSDNIQVPMKVDEVLDLYIKLSQGLQQIHKQGIVHGQIFPKNIVGTKQNPKLINFYAGHNEAGGETLMTMPCFTGDNDEIKYLSPEFLGNAPDATSASDVYSLGLTMFYALTGKAPFEGLGFKDVVMAHFNGIKLDWPANLRKEKCFSRIEKVVSKVVIMDPKKRLSVKVFKEALLSIRDARMWWITSVLLDQYLE